MMHDAETLSDAQTESCRCLAIPNSAAKQTRFKATCQRRCIVRPHYNVAGYRILRSPSRYAREAAGFWCPVRNVRGSILKSQPMSADPALGQFVGPLEEAASPLSTSGNHAFFRWLETEITGRPSLRVRESDSRAICVNHKRQKLHSGVWQVLFLVSESSSQSHDR